MRWKNNPVNGEITRRKMLATAGASAITAFGVTTSAAREGVEIPYVKSRGEVLKTRTVPRAWWETELEARAAMKDLAGRYATHPAVSGVSLVNSDRKIAGKYVSRVEIDVGHEHSVDSFDVPDTDYGVTVGVRQRPPIEYHTHSCDDTWCDTTQYDSLKGGIRLDYSHSSTCKVSYDGTDHLMCAAHAVTDCGSTTPSTTVEHEGTDIGDVVDHDPEQDWAVIEHDGNFDRISALIAGHEIEVNGYISEQGLQDMKSNGDYAHHRGAKTCTTKGPVERVGIDLPYDSDCEGQGHYVEIDNCTYGGDSGAPHYETWTDSNGCEWASIVAPHKGGSDGDGGYSVGTAAHEIVDSNPIEFPGDGAQTTSIC